MTEWTDIFRIHKAET